MVTATAAPAAGLDLPGDAVAAGQAAGGVDQDRLERIARHRRHADLGRAVLVEANKPGPALEAARDEPGARIDALCRKLRCFACRHEHLHHPFNGMVGHARLFVENFP